MNTLSDNTNIPNYLKAFRLINVEDEKCDFERGKIPVRLHINVNYFFAQTDVSLQNNLHPAPRKQYVITLKGRLKFTVSNGSTFILEPGIILIAADILGEGHNWEIIDGNEWERIYIPLEDDADDYFVAD